MKYRPSKKNIKERYWYQIQNMTAKEIKETFKVSTATAYRWLKQTKKERRNKIESTKTISMKIELLKDDYEILEKYGYDFARNFKAQAEIVAAELRIAERANNN